MCGWWSLRIAISKSSWRKTPSVAICFIAFTFFRYSFRRCANGPKISPNLWLTFHARSLPKMVGRKNNFGQRPGVKSEPQVRRNLRAVRAAAEGIPEKRKRDETDRDGRCFAPR